MSVQAVIARVNARMEEIKMRDSTKEKLGRIMRILEDGIPVDAATIESKVGIGRWEVYRLINILILKIGMPIMPTKYGYLHAAHASKGDDVYILRRILGRHAADRRRLDILESEILKRWKGDERQDLIKVLGSSLPKYNTLDTSLKMLNAKIEKFAA